MISLWGTRICRQLRFERHERANQKPPERARSSGGESIKWSPTQKPAVLMQI